MLLAGLVVLVVGLAGSGDRSSDTGSTGGQDSLSVTDATALASDAVRGSSEDNGWVTDTTAPASDGVQGSGEDDGWVTDTTVARQWPPETAAAESSGEDDGWVTDTTAPASDAVWGWGEDDGWVTDTTVARQWPLETAATWDARFPGTWDGLRDCQDTFSLRVLDAPYVWHYFFDQSGGIDYGFDESEVIALAFIDPSFEPAAGTEMHTALGNLGLSTAQDLRNLSEDAINVRWYAWWVKREITYYGDAQHPSCASVLAGADAVLNAPLVTTTTAVTAPAVTSTTLHWSILPRTRHPTWDSRLPSDRDGLRGTDCHDTFRISVLSAPYAWHYFYDETGGIDYGKDESEVIGLAFKDSSFEPAAGTELHTALGNLGLSTAQDIRNLGEDAINVRWYAWYVKDKITLRGDAAHPSCASILAGADAVLNAPLVTTTTTAISG